MRSSGRQRFKPSCLAQAPAPSATNTLYNVYHQTVHYSHITGVLTLGRLFLKVGSLQSFSVAVSTPGILGLAHLRRKQLRNRKNGARSDGYIQPEAAPTAPNPPPLSMILASHSTVPVRVRLEPRPAFVRGLFCV